MCVSCGCWSQTGTSTGGDGNHLEDSSKMPNVNIIQTGKASGK